MVRSRFNDALLYAIDFAFHSLGESCQHALYFHLEKNFHIERVKIPEKIEEFDRALRLIFKDGAFFLERLILQKLCEELELKFEGNCFDFVKAIFKIKSMTLEGASMLTDLYFREIHVVGSE
ncbi:MAG: hypothetical protein QXZ25_04945 [Candidatus Bathyarchaeia archaeon]